MLFSSIRPLRGSVTALFVPHVHQRQAAGVTPDVVGQQPHKADLALWRESRAVAGDNQVRAIPERATGWQRLGARRVQPGARDPAFLQRPDERVLVYQRSSGQVEEV